MDSAFHQLCPRYSETLTPTAPTAIRLWETFAFTFYRASASHFMCMYVLSLNILYVSGMLRHGRGGGSLPTAEKKRKENGCVTSALCI